MPLHQRAGGAELGEDVVGAHARAGGRGNAHGRCIADGVGRGKTAPYPFTRRTELTADFGCSFDRTADGSGEMSGEAGHTA